MKKKHFVGTRIITLLLSITMLLGMLPITALAADVNQAVTVSASLYDGKNGVFIKPCTKFTVTPGLAKSYGFETDNLKKHENEVTMFDVLVKLHAEAMGITEPKPGALSGFLEIGETGFLSTVMGETSPFSMMLNGVMPNDGVYNTALKGYTGLTIDNAVVRNSDNLEFFFYQDSGYGDYYCWFEQNGSPVREISVPINEKLTLDLKGYMAMYYGCSTKEKISDMTSLLNGVQLVTFDNAGKFTDIVGTVTENGKVSLSFSEAGENLISAKGNGVTPLAAPYLKVNVTPALSAEERAQIVSEDKAALSFENFKGENSDISAVAKNLNLIKAGNSGKTSIYWVSNDTSVIKNDGIVIRPLNTDGDKTVTLTANISYGDASDKKDFEINVKAFGSSLEVLNIIKEKLPKTITPLEWKSDNTEKQDKNIIEMVRALVKAETAAADVANDCIPGVGQTQIVSDGTVNYGEKRVSSKNVTFTLKLGDATLEYTPSVTVNKKAATKEEAFKAEWLTFDTIKVSNDSENNVKTDLSLPKKDSKGYYTELEWTTNAPNVIEISSYATNDKFTAKVRRPALGETDAVVTLTAKIKPGSYWDYGMAPAGPMPTPANGTKTFTITVPSMTQAELNEAQTMVNEGIKLFTLDNVTERGTKEKVSLQALTYSIDNIPYNWNYVNKLPGFKEAYRAADVKWVSENSGITEVSSGATITRTDKDQIGDIVLTVSYNGASATKRFAAKVLAFTETDAAAENAVLKEISDALNFETIKKDNTTSNTVISDLALFEGAEKTADKLVFGKKIYHKTGANISWTSSNESIIKKGYSTFKVIRPLEDTEVTLTATLTSVKFANCPGVNTATKEIKLTVLGKDSNPILHNIASMYANKNADWWGNSLTGTWWNTIGMCAYKKQYSTTENIISDAAKQAYVNKTIASVAEGKSVASSNANILANAINSLSAMGYNPNSLWTVNRSEISAVNKLKAINIEDAKKGWYSTISPYVLQAFKQGDFGTSVQENANIEYLLSELNKEDNWAWGVGTPAMLLQGLNLYYDRAEVKNAVDTIITKLSSMQGTNGSFGSSNDDAMVILALAQLGINPDTDARFIKGENSLLDGLFTYKTADNSGFGFNDTTFNELATSQSFIALISAYRVMETGKAYNPYDFNDIKKSSAYATGSGGGNTPSEPSGDKELTVYLSLKTHNSTWISETAVKLKNDAKVYHAFKKVLDEKKYLYDGAENNYVTSITNPSGNTLSEFTMGINSGWLYKVNGQLPELGICDTSLKNGDRIEFYYTTDWAKDPEASKHGAGNSTVQIETKPEIANGKITASASVNAVTDKNGKASSTVSLQDISDAIKQISDKIKDNKDIKREVSLQIKAEKNVKIVETTISKSTIKSLSENADLLKLETPVATFSIEKTVLEKLLKEASDVKISAEKVDLSKKDYVSSDTRKLIGENPVFDFKITNGSKTISQLGGNISLSLPYVPEKGIDTNKLTIYYIAEDGSVKKMPDAHYDANNKCITFTTNHFSTFAVVYEKTKVVFTDVTTNDWFSDAVYWTVQNEVMNGTGKDSFAPNAGTTRAMVLTILYRLNGGKTSENAKTWYEDACKWAVENKISDGSNVELNVTREQLSAMLMRYTEYKSGKPITIEQIKPTFADTSKISNWANNAIIWATQNGLLTGKPGNLLNPQGNATRAEVATMLMRFAKK